jgi:hypothetical protein
MDGGISMKRIKLGNSSLSVPAIAVGCMRINSMNDDNLAAHLTFKPPLFEHDC